MAKDNFNVRIGIIDDATGAIDKINKRLLAMQAPFKKLSASMSKFSDLTGLTALYNMFGKLGSMVMGVFNSLLKVVPVLGGLTGVASLAGMHALLEGWMKFGVTLDNSAAQLGITASQLQNVQNAGRMFNATAEQMTGLLDSIADSTQKVAAGGLPQLAVQIKKLVGGIDLDPGHQAKSPLYYLEQYITALQKYAGNPKVQTQAAVDLVGAGAADALLKIVRGGPKAWEAAKKAVQEYGFASDANTLAAKAAFQAHMKLTLAMEKFGNTIAMTVGPAWTKLLEWLERFVTTNSHTVAQALADAVRWLGHWLERIRWKEVRADFEWFWGKVKDIGKSIWDLSKSFNDLITSTIGWKNLIIGLSVTALAAPFLALAIALNPLSLTLAAIVASIAAVAAFSGPGHGWLTELRNRITGEHNDPTSKDQHAAAREFRDRIMADKDLGLGSDDARAFVLNAYRESSMNPGSRTFDAKGNASEGLLQWRKERLSALQTHSGEHDIKKISIEQQVAFLKHELLTTERATLEALKAAKTVEQKAEIITRMFERPLDPKADQKRNMKFDKSDIYGDQEQEVERKLEAARQANAEAAAARQRLDKLEELKDAQEQSERDARMGDDHEQFRLRKWREDHLPKQESRLDINIDHSNVPQGVKLAAEAHGSFPVNLNIGRAMPAFARV